MARTFTREAFHALIWSRPMTHLGKEFGLSDVALHKICRKHGIPVPPRGWWARKASGRAVRVRKLPPAPEDRENRIVIASHELGAEHDSFADIREAARIRASAAPAVDASASHPVVRRTLAALRKATPAHTGLITAEAGTGLIRYEVAKASLDRLEALLSSIVAAAAQRGSSRRQRA